MNSPHPDTSPVDVHHDPCSRIGVTSTGPGSVGKLPHKFGKREGYLLLLVFREATIFTGDQ